ncbi:MAG: hypothetical protein IJ960_06720 [Oscillospiraceae bacterium]|nr:hypothetical protein [Oscillospiraceae bacterium]
MQFSRRKYYEYQIDGQPLLVPDADVQISAGDLDAEDSGRDESGFMHRLVVRERVKTWSFSYAVLAHLDYWYLEKLFAGKPDFEFTHRGFDGQPVTTRAYCSKSSITFHDARRGIYKNYKFNIIEC